jgi:hypothetical protein
MIEFDKQLWWDRAWARFKRATRKGCSRKKRDEAERQWFREAMCIDKLAAVIDWCSSKNIKVRFGKSVGASYNAIEKTITMAGRTSPEKQLYMLLHECGHHLVGFDEDDERFGMGYPYVEDSKVNTTFHHRVACLEEEMEAWHRGWRLSKRLHLNLDRPAFDKVRLDCLRSYIKWANGRSLMITE